jgi:spore germination cell wall hydrolase CwlJ-like protein
MKLSTQVGLVGSLLTVVFMTAIGVNASQLELKQENYASLDRYRSRQTNPESVDFEQLRCLATNIYFEARGESKLAQKAVAWVTLNRVESTSYPDTICDVVWDGKQFSWTHDGKSDVPKDKEAWDDAQMYALQVLIDHQLGRGDPTDGSIMFHAAYVKPSWHKDYEVTSRIDNHIFYKEESS